MGESFLQVNEQENIFIWVSSKLMNWVN